MNIIRSMIDKLEQFIIFNEAIPALEYQKVTYHPCNTSFCPSVCLFLSLSVSLLVPLSVSFLFCPLAYLSVCLFVHYINIKKNI